MSKFACITYCDYQILANKINTFIKYSCFFIEETVYAHIEGYTIYVLTDKKFPSNKKWEKLEKFLFNRGVEYIAIEDFEFPYAFTYLKQVDGMHLKRLLAPHILRYIFKYRLIKSEAKYAKIGIICGKIGETLDVIGGIVDDMTDLTLFTEDSTGYKEIVQEVYQLSRLKIRLMPPTRLKMQEMDVVFDLSSRKHYYSWCQPKAIYVDFVKRTKVVVPRQDLVTPLMWCHFDIFFLESVLRPMDIEAILYADGFSKWALRRKVKELPIRIAKTYTPYQVDKVRAVGYNFKVKKQIK
jgi:hypothetical protein